MSGWLVRVGAFCSCSVCVTGNTCVWYLLIVSAVCSTAHIFLSATDVQDFFFRTAQLLVPLYTVFIIQDTSGIRFMVLLHPSKLTTKLEL